jgi:nitrogen fixation/metabolism regulation signal transduction histidine kinase
VSSGAEETAVADPGANAPVAARPSGTGPARRGTFSIQVKIVSLTLVILVAGLALSVYVTINNQRSNLLEAAQRTLSINTDLLNSTIQNLMLAGEAPVAVNAMRSFKDIQGFLDITLYRPDGTAAFSDTTTITKVNAYNPKAHFLPTPRVPVTTLSDPNFTRAVNTRLPVQVELTKEKALEYFFPIINIPDCRVCHGYGGFVRGVAHIKLSISGVYDQIQSAAMLLEILFAAVGVVIAGLLLLMLNRTIISPVLAIGRVARAVGGGDLLARVRVRTRDELGALGGTLNDMIAGLQERNELVLRNRVIDARNTENRKYLDTIQEGLLLVNRDLVISEQYSRYLGEMFSVSSIAGRSLPDFLYPDAAAHAAEREEIVRFFEILFTNTTADMEMILSLNPLHDRTLTATVDGVKREIVVDALYHRIVEDGAVQNVMVIFEDRTGLVQAQRELAFARERSEEELSHIAAILKAGPEAFQEFADQADAAVERLLAEHSGLRGRKEADALFRVMHSLKGAARYLEFSGIERVAHSVEEILAACRDQARPPDAEETRRLAALVQSIQKEVGAIRALNDRFRQFAVAEGGVESLYRELMSSLKRMAIDIGRTRHKEVSFRAFGALESRDLVKKLRDPLIHLVRNAVDHGLEEELERLSVNKPKAGLITIVAARRQGGWMVRVTDDGRGIDFDRVRARALEVGLLPPGTGADVPRTELLKLLFSPRLSLAPEATEISGRGVGLDVVQETVRALGGKVFVATRLGEGTSITLRLPAG